MKQPIENIQKEEENKKIRIFLDQNNNFELSTQGTVVEKSHGAFASKQGCAVLRGDYQQAPDSQAMLCMIHFINKPNDWDTYGKILLQKKLDDSAYAVGWSGQQEPLMQVYGQKESCKKRNFFHFVIESAYLIKNENQSQLLSLLKKMFLSSLDWHEEHMFINREGKHTQRTGVYLRGCNNVSFETPLAHLNKSLSFDHMSLLLQFITKELNLNNLQKEEIMLIGYQMMCNPNANSSQKKPVLKIIDKLFMEEKILSDKIKNELFSDFLNKKEHLSNMTDSAFGKAVQQYKENNKELLDLLASFPRKALKKEDNYSINDIKALNAIAQNPVLLEILRFNAFDLVKLLTACDTLTCDTLNVKQLKTAVEASLFDKLSETRGDNRSRLL